MFRRQQRRAIASDSWQLCGGENTVNRVILFPAKPLPSCSFPLHTPIAIFKHNKQHSGNAKLFLHVFILFIIVFLRLSKCQSRSGNRIESCLDAVVDALSDLLKQFLLCNGVRTLLKAIPHKHQQHALFGSLRVGAHIYVKDSLVEHVHHLHHESGQHIGVRSPLGVYILNIQIVCLQHQENMQKTLSDSRTGGREGL